MKQSSSIDKHFQSRYCPEETSHRGCQVQCFTLQPHKNHADFLKGLDDVDKWNIDRKYALKAMYGNFLRRGNNFTGSPEGTAINILSLDNHVKDKDTALILPTYIPERTSITKFDDHLISGATSWGANLRFPCSCGDCRSNETSGFMYAFGYAPPRPSVLAQQSQLSSFLILKAFQERETFLGLLAKYR
ncbi:hypothetical protein L207DRAFT_517601 [Hyaloscypha variabilis F]|uniref:Uncharacterized protein n=1 Tax=Hyaloscypha variabilis (strain UAMH 11265 / GT02V1 / F) TaxID=1149755 RepID=A0A2J6R7J0_HYAVF|nr:hypothetical protein L207DRAFT_517601 [Hyaloscypha variabilis F]